MAKNLSTVKRIQIAARNNKLNKNYKSSIKSIIKKTIKANIVSDINDYAEFKEVRFLISQAYSKIDKAVKKGVVHKNTAARKKSRLAKALKSVK